MSQVQYKIYAKIKSMQNGVKCLDLLDPKTIQMRKGNEVNLIHLNWILSSSDSQEKSYDLVAKKSVEKLIEGFSSIILCYGAESSGKTYTIIGRQQFLYTSLGNPEHHPQDLNRKYNFNEKGIVLRAIEFIFSKAKSYQHLKHFIVSCSCLEMRKEKIIDLGKKYLKTESPNKQVRFANNEFLAIQEDKNGNFDLTNLTVTNIKNVHNFTVFLKEILKGRQQQNSHFIIQINLLQSDKEKSDLENTESSITLVELGYLNQQNDDRQDQSVILQSQLNALSQILKKIKHVEALNQVFRQTKLTKILKQAFLKSSLVSLVGTIDFTNENYESTISTLNYLNKCKPANEPKQIEQNYQNSLSELKNKYNKEMKKYDLLVEQNKQKIQLIQEYIGIEINLNDIHKNTIKEIVALNNFKQAIEKVKYLTEERTENDKQILQLQLKLSKQMKLEQQRQQEFHENKAKLEDHKERLKIQIEQLKLKEKNVLRQQITNFQRTMEDYNAQNNISKNAFFRQYDTISRLGANLNTFTQINVHIEQTTQSALNQANERFYKKVNMLNEQRQERIAELKQEYQRKIRTLERNNERNQRKDQINSIRNEQIAYEIIQLVQVLQQQQKIIKILESIKSQNNYCAAQLIKKYKTSKNAGVLDHNFNRVFTESVEAVKKKHDRQKYRQTLIKFYKQELFQLKLKKKKLYQF